jgi:hypothetical protein
LFTHTHAHRTRTRTQYLLIQTRKGVCLKLLLEYRTPGEGRYESIISTPKSKANEPLSTQFLPVPLQQFPYQDNVSLGVQKTWQGCLVGSFAFSLSCVVSCRVVRVVRVSVCRVRVKHWSI